MTTIIRSNGSKWAGESPDTLDDLITVLGTHALAAKFEDYGNFVMKCTTTYLDALNGAGANLAPHALHFWGNFEELSHVFDVLTDDQEVIDRLVAAIKANKRTPAYYKARDDWKAEKERRAADAAKREARDAENFRRYGR
jgi:hypothetical protein